MRRGLRMYVYGRLKKGKNLWWDRQSHALLKKAFVSTHSWQSKKAPCLVIAALWPGMEATRSAMQSSRIRSLWAEKKGCCWLMPGSWWEWEETAFVDQLYVGVIRGMFYIEDSKQSCFAWGWIAVHLRFYSAAPCAAYSWLRHSGSVQCDVSCDDHVSHTTVSNCSKCAPDIHYTKKVKDICQYLYLNHKVKANSWNSTKYLENFKISLTFLCRVCNLRTARHHWRNSAYVIIAALAHGSQNVEREYFRPSQYIVKCTWDLKSCDIQVREYSQFIGIHNIPSLRSLCICCNNIMKTQVLYMKHAYW